MDFKKRMLQSFASKVNQELEEYKLEYQQLLRKEAMDADNSYTFAERTEICVQCEEDDNISFCRESLPSNSIVKDIHSNEIDTTKLSSISKEENAYGNLINKTIESQVDHCQNIDYAGLQLNTTNSHTTLKEVKTDGNNVRSQLNTTNNHTTLKEVETDGNNVRGTDLVQHLPIVNQYSIDESLMDGESRLFNNSMNMYSTNQTFYGSEFRRKARRRTGKLVVKRRYNLIGGSEDVFKRTRTDKLENFYEVYKDMLESTKENIMCQPHHKEVEELKSKLNDAERRLKQKHEKEEQEEILRIKNERLEISKQIEMGMAKLVTIRNDVNLEIKKIEEERKRFKKEEMRNKQHIQKMIAEKKIAEEEMIAESMRLEAEKTMIADEKKKIEESKQLEAKRLEARMKKMEIERQEEMQRFKKEKEALELKLMEDAQRTQLERKLLEQEREKINQTFLEITRRSAHEPVKPKEVKIQLPPIFPSSDTAKKCTIKSNMPQKSINQLFSTAKREYTERLDQTTLASMENTQKSKPILSQAPNKPFQGMINIERMNPHKLYKTSIDFQTKSNDPKKYIPKVLIPFYTNEDEFESDNKKFVPAPFTKDPKLNFTVKSQNHDEIRAYFGNKKDIDVETIFNEIENVTNYSPNKLNRKH